MKSIENNITIDIIIIVNKTINKGISMKNLTPTDYIQIISIIISTIVGVISVVISVKAIGIAKKSNELTLKITEDANRPVVTAYLETVQINSSHKYMVIKNFGQTSAVINKLSFDKSLDAWNYNMKSIENTIIAPNQKYTHVLDNDFTEKVSVQIVYTDMQGKKYNETYNIDTDAPSKLFYLSDTNTDPQYKLIKNSIEELIKTLK